MALERLFEGLIHASRWLFAPFLLGLVVAMGVLLLKFSRDLWDMSRSVWLGNDGFDITSVLRLVDAALVAGLLLIIIFSAHKSFIAIDRQPEERSVWFGKVGFSELKLRLIGALVAISAVELLIAFVDLEDWTDRALKWKIAIHLTLALGGVLFAITDWLAARAKREESAALERD
ncbi:MAG: YqhA family protein [Rubrimonas sp.]